MVKARHTGLPEQIDLTPLEEGTMRRYCRSIFTLIGFVISAALFLLMAHPVAAQEPEAAPAMPTQDELKASWPPAALLPLPSDDVGIAGTAEESELQQPASCFGSKVLAFLTYRRGWRLGALGCSLPFTVLNEPVRSSKPLSNPMLDARGYRLAYVVAHTEDDLEIHRINVDGTNHLRLTDSSGIDTMPEWHPSREEMLFVSDRSSNADVFKMNTDGSSQRRLTFSPLADIHPVYTPGGDEIAWVRSAGAWREIWMMNADGSNPHKLAGPFPWIQRLIFTTHDSRITFDADMNGDGWNDAAYVELETGAVGVWGYAPPLSDYFINASSHTTNSMMIITHAQYELHKGKYYLVSLQVKEAGEAGGVFSAGLIAHDLPIWMNASLGLPTNAHRPELRLAYPRDTIMAMYLELYMDMTPGITIFDPDPTPMRCTTEARRNASDRWLTGKEAEALLLSGRAEIRTQCVDKDDRTSNVLYPCRPGGCTVAALATKVLIKDLRGIPMPGVEIVYPETIELTRTTGATGIASFRGRKFVGSQYWHGPWYVSLPWAQPKRIDLSPVWLYDFSDEANIEKSILWDGSDAQSEALAPIRFENWQISSPNDAVQRSYLNDALTIFGPSFEALIRVEITLPVTMNQPTLYIEYYEVNTPSEIEVGDGILTRTLPLHALATTNYRKAGWVDLAAWQGRPITIRFVPSPALPTVDWMIYTATIGSWRTPLVSMVAPLAIDDDAVTTLSITGSNFLTGVQVSVGEHPLATTRLNSTQLEVVVPAGLGEGLYPIWVTNEGGIALFSGKLRVGTPFYFPWSTAYWSSR